MIMIRRAPRDGQMRELHCRAIFCFHGRAAAFAFRMPMQHSRHTANAASGLDAAKMR